MITTTLKNIKSHKPCQPGWLQLLKGLDKKRADNKPLRLETILEINGLEDAIWGLRAVDVKYEPAIRLYNCWQAKQVLHVFEQAYPNDSRVKIVIETSERFAWGRATFEELVDATSDAWATWATNWDAAESSARDAAWAAARAAAWAAAGDARDAARAAWDAAWDAAGDAVWAAAGAAGTARIAAWDVWASAWDAWDAVAREEFIRLIRLEGVYGEIMEKAHATAI